MEANGISEKLRESLIRELEFSYTRSSGPGGQHVNKVSSCVTLKFNVDQSQALTDLQKDQIHLKLGNRLTTEGVLILESQKERSQFRNKHIVTDRFFDLISEALVPPKERISTKPTKASKKQRLEEKRKTAVKKELRKPPEL